MAIFLSSLRLVGRFLKYFFTSKSVCFLVVKIRICKPSLALIPFWPLYCLEKEKTKRVKDMHRIPTFRQRTVCGVSSPTDTFFFFFVIESNGYLSTLTFGAKSNVGNVGRDMHRIASTSKRVSRTAF